MDSNNFNNDLSSNMSPGVNDNNSFATPVQPTVVPAQTPVAPSPVSVQTVTASPSTDLQQPIIAQQAPIGMNGVESQPVATSDINGGVVNSVAPIPSMAPSIDAVQSQTNTVSVVDEDLVRSYVGKNYDNFKTQKFNVGGFFLTTFYMFYRKMFLYAVLLFVITLVMQNFVKVYVSFGANLLVGFLINKLYLSFAAKKVANLKMKNPQMTHDELKVLCSAKGGTSVGQAILGFFLEIVIMFVTLIFMLIAGLGNLLSQAMDADNWNVNTSTGSTESSYEDTNKENKLEDVKLVLDYCIGEKCEFKVDSDTYIYEGEKAEFLTDLKDYYDYIKLNIYYEVDGNTRNIVDYDIFVKSSGKDISDVSSIDELVTEIGSYAEGTYSEELTFVELGMKGSGYENGISYTYTNYVFKAPNGFEYKMKHIDTNGSLSLVEGNSYTVSFTVTNDSFGYEYTINSIA